MVKVNEMFTPRPLFYDLEIIFVIQLATSLFIHVICCLENLSSDFIRLVKLKMEKRIGFFSNDK